MSDTAKYVVIVEGAILRDDRYLLIVRGPDENYAPGRLALVGGKVEASDHTGDVFENALIREIREEVGLRVTKTAYVQSEHFMADQDSAVDTIFLCLCDPGEPRIADPGEVAGTLWLTAAEIARHPDVPDYLKANIERAEQTRVRLGW